MPDRHGAASRQASNSTARPSGEDGAALLGQRDELVGLDEAAGRVVPAGERLDAEREARREATARAGRTRRSRPCRPRARARSTSRGGRRSPRASWDRTPRTGSCRPAWPCTSPRRRCAAGRRPGRRARGCAAMPMLADTFRSWPVDRERDGERGDEARRDGHRGAEVRLVEQQDRELVAAEAGRHVAGADARLDAVGDRGEQPVAGRVPQGVVDVLEVVEVEEQDDRDPVGGRVLERAVRPARRTGCGWRGRSAGRGRPGTGAAP